jgi:lysylphosphatidylglycerol synthetase-like protein (DUF2156 family)
MNEFVEQCRDEWKRLRVPEAIANEMAADLDADLEEARAEGTSAEDVLGRDAFDPRAFAVKWAAARGVIPPASAAAVQSVKPRWRTGMVVALAAFAVIAIFGLALASHRAGTSRSIAVGPAWRFAQPVGPPMVAQDHAFFFPIAFGVFLLLAGIAGAAVTIYYWSRNNRPSGPSYS